MRWLDNIRYLFWYSCPHFPTQHPAGVLDPWMEKNSPQSARPSSWSPSSNHSQRAQRHSLDEVCDPLPCTRISRWHQPSWSKPWPNQCQWPSVAAAACWRRSWSHPKWHPPVAACRSLHLAWSCLRCAYGHGVWEGMAFVCQSEFKLPMASLHDPTVNGAIAWMGETKSRAYGVTTEMGSPKKKEHRLTRMHKGASVLMSSSSARTCCLCLLRWYCRALSWNEQNHLCTQTPQEDWRTSLSRRFACPTWSPQASKDH